MGLRLMLYFFSCFCFLFFLRSPQGDCIHFLMIKVIFECTIWAKDLQPKGNRNVPMSFPFAFISGLALRNGKASSIHYCSQVRSQKDDSEMASDTRQSLSRGRAWERQHLASSAENLHSPNEGGTQGSGMGRAGSTVRTWNTQGQTYLVNYSNCEEGALSRQADRIHCRIKGYPSAETPSPAPSLGCSICNKNQNLSASIFLLLQLPKEPCTGSDT